MSPVGIAHVCFGVLALVLGGLVFSQPKGTQRHRRIGYGYVVSMLMLNGLSFLMYRFTGHFGHLGPFHILSIISLVTLANGWMVAFFRRPADRWLQIHIWWMGWSYIGLWAATATEVMVRLPFVQNGSSALLAIVGTTLVVTGIGMVFLTRYMRTSPFRPFTPAARQPDVS